MLPVDKNYSYGLLCFNIRSLKHAPVLIRNIRKCKQSRLCNFIHSKDL